MANYLKPQSPLQHKDGNYFYPLTTIDQIITDNDTRLNAELISVDFSNVVDNNGEMIITNADMLNGKTIEEIFNEIINYSIVGGVTEPSNPIENMIWIETSIEITKHIFSKNEPKNPIKGMVWIYLSNNSNVSFHTLNINGKEFNEVYPISAMQYESGAWVDKTAKIYQNSAWVDWWNGELFDNGNQYEAVTGGWKSTAVKTYYGAEAPSLSISGGKMEMSISGNKSGIVSPDNLTDVSKFSHLEVVVDSMNNGNISVRFYASRTPSDGDSENIGLSSLTVGTNNVALPTTSPVCISFMIQNGASLTVSSVKLIR